MINTRPERPGARRQPGLSALAGLSSVSSHSYDRRKDLPQLVGLEEADIADLSAQTAARLLRRISRALRRERALGQSGRGGYDPARHLALLKAYRFEVSLAGLMPPLERRV
jgi:hypothetical protein